MSGLARACVFVIAVTAAGIARAEPPSFTVGIGQLGMRRVVPHAVAVDVQVRAPWEWMLLRPIAGVLTSSTGGAYVYSGVMLDVPLGGSVRLAPGLAAGAVVAPGDRDLGFPLEFRSSLELSVAPSDAVRCGVAFSHVSNARLGDHNPGVEVLTFALTFPARR
jgi:hypothetical protein